MKTRSALRYRFAMICVTVTVPGVSATVEPAAAACLEAISYKPAEASDGCVPKLEKVVSSQSVPMCSDFTRAHGGRQLSCSASHVRFIRSFVSLANRGAPGSYPDS